MASYEYKTIELPFTFGVVKRGMPDIDGALNKEAGNGWRLKQILMPAGNYGVTEKILAVLEREQAG